MSERRLTAEECAARVGMTRDAWLAELREMVVTSYDDGDALDLRRLDESEVQQIHRGLREVDAAVSALMDGGADG